MKLFKKAKKGFTLVELVVVIAVIAILAAVSVGAYFGVTESAKNSKADQEAKALHTALMLVVNNPETGVGLDDEGKLTYTAPNADDDGKVTKGNFEEQIEAVTGIDYTVTESAATNPTVATIYVQKATTISYYTDQGVERVITVKTGDISDPNA